MQCDQQPVTLAEAQEMQWRLRPAKDAGPAEWIAFHRRNATVYGQVAEVDTRHRFEALQHVGMEIRKARMIEHRLYPDLDQDGDD